MILEKAAIREKITQFSPSWFFEIPVPGGGRGAGPKGYGKGKGTGFFGGRYTPYGMKMGPTCSIKLQSRASEDIFGGTDHEEKTRDPAILCRDCAVLTIPHFGFHFFVEFVKVAHSFFVFREGGGGCRVLGMSPKVLKMLKITPLPTPSLASCITARHRQPSCPIPRSGFECCVPPSVVCGGSPSPRVSQVRSWTRRSERGGKHSRLQMEYPRLFRRKGV